MKLWIGAEMNADVADLLRPARKAVEDAVNAVVENKDYRLPVDDWDCIAIIRDDENFAEKFMFSKKKRDMDFRLRIPYLPFKLASPIEREAMIFEMLERSLVALKFKAEDVGDLDDLVTDLKRIELSKGISRP